MAKEKILVVDDEEDILELIRFNLVREGYKVLCAPSGEEALSIARSEMPGLMVLDLMLPGIDGLETYKKILRIRPKQKTIITSGYSETSRVKKALSLGAGAYMKKPFLYNQIGYLVRTELDKRTKDINRDSGL